MSNWDEICWDTEEDLLTMVDLVGIRQAEQEADVVELAARGHLRLIVDSGWLDGSLARRRKETGVRIAEVAQIH